jgi:uncharacterized protein affecting Mg2+/Co2+ transport
LIRMVTEITQGIKVSVETEYQPAYSSPSQYHYVFTYRITIENQSEYTIQLMRRHWHIYDAGFNMREVEGEGVVGQQPVLGARPNASICFRMQFKIRYRKNGRHLHDGTGC